LFYGDDELEEDEKKLSEYGIKDQSSVTLSYTYVDEHVF